MRKISQFGIAVLLVFTVFAGMINFASDNVQAPPTYVTGSVYDGFGGPWTVAGSPYIVIGGVEVPPGETLTIQPGVQIKINPYAVFQVSGNLFAVGTATKRINITSNVTNPGPLDYWWGFRIEKSGYAEIKYSDISYDEYGIKIYSSNNVLTYNTISKIGSHGILLSESSSNIIKFNNIWDNMGGFRIYDSSFNTIDNNNIFSSEGIVLDSSTRNNISNNIITSPSFSGIELDSSSFNNITNNDVSGASYTGIELHSSSFNNITNNVISWSSWYGMWITDSSDNNINNNALSNNVKLGLYIGSSLNNSITDNDFIEDGIFLEGNSVNHFNSHIMPTNNIIDGKPLYYYKDCSGLNINGIMIGGLILANCTNVNVNNSHINSSGGLEVAYSTNVLISNNTISSSEWHGIYSYSSSNNSMINNTINLNNRDGIHFHSSSSNNVTNNNISLNKWDGINMRKSSNNNSIINNTILENNWGGIRAGESSNNDITNNTISMNTFGISLGDSLNNKITGNIISLNNGGGLQLSSSSDNRIYHNNLIDNNYQAIDEMNNNFWNDTYPSGGNYWSDYSPSCQDLYNGSLTPQTSGSPDGICDFQYDIDADSIDYYPLTDPIGFQLPAPPTNLSAELSGINLENVTISWNASLDDPVNITNYAIYYGTSYNFKGSNYLLLAEVAASGALNYNLTVQGKGEGDTNNYFFYVQVNTTLIYSYSKSRMQVAKYTINKTFDMHLMSIPLMPNNKSISSVLKTLGYNLAWSFNSTDTLNPWKLYNPLKPINDLKIVNHTMALWINVTRTSNLTVAGIVPQTTNIFLKAGWNLIGYPSFTDKNVSEALSTIIYERVEGYDNNPPQYLKVYNDNNKMKPGFGYWIKVPFDQTWTVTNS